MKSLSRYCSYLLVLTLLAPSGGCTLIGYGIGSAVERPRDERVLELDTVRSGTEVAVTCGGHVGPSAEAGGEVWTVEGVFLGAQDGHVLIQSGDQVFRIPISEIRQVRPRPGPETHADSGAIVGGIVDGVIIVGGVVLLKVWTSHEGDDDF